ncbi:tripartite-type tricarboxylate transporter receptor subunit TctC [Variovorax boronicumulans]|uniref:Tripartite-type tricarboxylate transporter receptor subunit TctC n=1 Tax=Variovorax boronicumulans TaxID=436515 RepID=A0AAW8DUS7_9BURK|nr:tripartite tricarboxylate transporter substrate binding protein [Variovorax boronicumulans]MDP9877712.1 tripartite-type tricarboxylate transporter receptor subunit TctC [Variovorax boronicumulans]MDP9922996.1 tripartite-type tricarboxylate transporter receptor subunit TctC [Variovorax boronicumulans]
MRILTLIGRLFTAGSLALGLGVTAMAQGSAYPNKPIRLVVPYPPGGATDVAARMLSPRLQEELGQTVVVENRPGAGGNIAMYNVVQSGADGYTLAMTLTGMLSINPVIYKKAGFAASDFVPVARVSLAPLLLVVPEKSPYKSVQDLLAAGKKAGKGGMAYGSAGAGGLSHLASESINGHANGNFTHVPYKGGAPLVQALMANEVAWGLLGTGDARSFVQSGKLKAIGQLRNGRSELWPDIPTLTEQGVPGGVDFDVWFGVVAPAKTPAPVVKLLGEKIAKITAEPAFRQRLNDLGGVAPATGNTPEAFADVLRRELAVLPKAAQEAGLQLD